MTARVESCRSGFAGHLRITMRRSLLVVAARVVTVLSLATAMAIGCRGVTTTRGPAVETSLSPGTRREPPASGEYSLYELPSTWRDQRGDTLHLSDLAGRVRVVAMVYTSCQATCPLIVADLKHIESSIAAAQRRDIGFVLVSLDPWRDTPGRLAAWAQKTGLDSARWTLLSGSDDAVRELAASLDVRYQKQQNGEFAHTNGLTVLDRAGAVTHRQSGLGDVDATIGAVRALLR